MSQQSHVGAIVVGSGIFGASTAHHLALAGVGPVVVLDAGDPGAGTSLSGAGFVGYFAAGYMPFSSADDLTLQDYGVGFYRSLSEGRASINYRNNGSLFVAVSDERVEHVSRMADNELAPPGTRVLDPHETETLSGGLLDAAVVTAAVHHPGGIQISAGRATRAVLALLADQGIEVRSGTRALALLIDERGVAGVATPHGDLHSRVVVVASGAWTNELLSSVGVELPMARHIVSRISSPDSGVAASAPTVMVPEWESLWLREDRGGLTWGNTVGCAPLTDFEPSIEVGGHPRVAELINRMNEDLEPRLDRLVSRHDHSIGSWTQGLPCYTADGICIAGPVAEVSGLFVLAGDNESGVTHGPGLARIVADQVAGNSIGYVDPGRYAPARFADEAMSEDEVTATMPEYGA